MLNVQRMQMTFYYVTDAVTNRDATVPVKFHSRAVFTRSPIRHVTQDRGISQLFCQFISDFECTIFPIFLILCSPGRPLSAPFISTSSIGEKVTLHNKSVNALVRPQDRLWLTYFQKMKLDHDAVSVLHSFKPTS